MKHVKFLRMVIVMLIATLTILQVCLAAEPEYYFSDIEKGEVTITGVLPADSRYDWVTITALNPGYTKDTADSADADAAINNMTTSKLNSDGSFTAKLNLRNLTDRSIYNIIIRSYGMDDVITIPVTYYDPNTLVANIATEIREGDKSGLESYLNDDSVKIIGIRLAELGNISVSELCALVDNAPDTSVSPTVESVRRSLEKKAVLNMLKNGTAENLIKSVGTQEAAFDIICAGNKDYVPFSILKETSDAIRNDVAATLNGKTYADWDSFVSSVSVEVLNSVIKNAENYLGVRDIMAKYEEGGLFTTDYSNEYAQLDKTQSAKAEAALQTYATSRPFTSVNDAAIKFLEYINAYSEKQGSTTSNSGGGGGGGGGKTSGNSSGNFSVSADIVSDITQNKAEVGTKPFIDIDSVPWAEESIVALEKKGVISGREKMKFEPNESVTREEFVKMIVTSLGIEVEDAECSFDDVFESDWYYPYVANAYTAGIINGVTEQFFGSGTDITREEMAVIIYRAAEFVGEHLEYGAYSFHDNSSISEYAQEAVGALSNANIMNGKDNGCFEPGATATRAEAAKVIYQTMVMCDKQ